MNTIIIIPPVIFQNSRGKNIDVQHLEEMKMLLNIGFAVYCIAAIVFVCMVIDWTILSKKRNSKNKTNRQ